MKLYNKSSIGALNLIEEEIQPIAADHIKVKDYDANRLKNHINCTLKKNGLRLMWDALMNREHLRATLILQYFKESEILNDSSSLNYFELQLKDSLMDFIMFEDAQIISESLIAISILLVDSSSCFIQKFKNDLLSNFDKIIFNCISLFKNIEIGRGNSNYYTAEPIPVHLFIEDETKFCEFPQLKDISVIPSNLSDKDVFKILNDFKIEIKRIINEYLLNNPGVILKGSGSSIASLYSALDQLELDENVTFHLKQIKFKEDFEKFKYQYTDFFDNFMKSVQLSLKTLHDKVDTLSLLEKKRSILDILKESKEIEASEEFKILIENSRKVSRNKLNIIFTINRNGNGTKSLQIAMKYIQSFCSDAGESEFSGGSDVISREIGCIYEMFFTAWMEDIKVEYGKRVSEENELFALIWISNLLLKLSIKEKIQVLESIGISHATVNETIKTKYPHQLALLSGIIEAEKPSTPKLKHAQLPPSNTLLLPHFTIL